MFSIRRSKRNSFVIRVGILGTRVEATVQPQELGSWVRRDHEQMSQRWPREILGTRDEQTVQIQETGSWVRRDPEEMSQWWRRGIQPDILEAGIQPDILGTTRPYN